MKWALAALLAINAGYVDATGFLALHGLFATHVTGNFVTIGAALAFGASGVLAKLLALPWFCVVVVAVTFLSGALERRSLPGLRVMFAIQFALLAGAAAVAAQAGSFPDGDAWPALLAGGLLVAAMAIQNAVHRMQLSAVPVTTVMTMTTTQVMVDLAGILRGVSGEAGAAARRRLGPMAFGVACFAAGCAAAALAFGRLGGWSFSAPPAVAALVFLLAREKPAA